MYPRRSDIVREFVLRKCYHREFWALRNISFQVRKGICFGIIGRNGSGKSTLLKILAGTLDKTAGDVSINGNVSAILELGTGFHPDYSGRDNIYLGGLCLGMTNEVVQDKLDWIIRFSELGNAIDQPFKTYSSGMKARLTFATAMSVEPDILIIDEALATGDGYFVAKCLARLREICDSGATVLFVSHSIPLVNDFCDQVLWLDEGTVVDCGDANELCSRYELDLVQRQHHSITKESCPSSEMRSSTVKADGGYRFQRSEIAVTRCVLKDRCSREVNVFRQGEDICVEFEWEGSHSRPCHLVVAVRNPRGLVVSGFNSSEADIHLNFVERRGTVQCWIPSNAFGAGDYSLTVAIVESHHAQQAHTEVFYEKNVNHFHILRLGKYDYSYIYEPKVSWHLSSEHSIAS
jgi:lipopolysaccharide transport system ATP-binding protein